MHSAPVAAVLVLFPVDSAGRAQQIEGALNNARIIALVTAGDSFTSWSLRSTCSVSFC
jgi:hypothetical protein